MNIPAADLALAQGLYYVVMGLWPVANIRSFQLVTGPKTDLWLVKTTGLLIAVIGAYVLAGRGETAALAAGSALALGAVDVIYSVKRVISPVYLLDAAVEGALVCAWAAAGLLTP
jgi:hypothetical protein